MPINKIVFIGTLPTLIDEEPQRWPTKSGWKYSPSGSSFSLVRQFLQNYVGEYWFVHNGLLGTHGLQLDPAFNEHTIQMDLRETLPSSVDELKGADLVYIDSDTLGYVDHTKTAKEWIDIFEPLLSDNGCIVIDDDQDSIFPPRISPVQNLDVFLGKEVYRGLTTRFMPPFDLANVYRGGFDGVLLNILNFAKREYPLLLFRCEGLNDGIMTSDDITDDIIAQKFGWRPDTDIDDMYYANGWGKRFKSSC